MAPVGLAENGAFQKLKNELGDKCKQVNMAQEFARDLKRAEKFSRQLLNAAGQLQVHLDFSKNLIDEAIFGQLMDIVSKKDIKIDKKI